MATRTTRSSEVVIFQLVPGSLSTVRREVITLLAVDPTVRDGVQRLARNRYGPFPGEGLIGLEGHSSSCRRRSLIIGCGSLSVLPGGTPSVR